jgi:hypothetical protein
VPSGTLCRLKEIYMRSPVLRIFSPDHENVIAAFYALLLFLFLASAQAQAQALSFPALKIQTQQQPTRPRAARPAPAQKKRGLSPLQNDEAAAGSRVTITYNEPLSDYSAYRRGDQFVVVIPKSDAPRIRSGLRGRGFEGVQVEKRGDDTVLSFRIQPGTKARVDQQHNRLEVIFSKPVQASATATAPGSQHTTSATPTVKPPQGTQATGALPTQTPLANHNSTATDQQRVAGADSTADATAAPTTPSDAAAPVTATPSTEVSASTPSTENNTTAVAEPTPLSSRRTTFAALKTLASRHWLPLLIGTALLASAYLALSARRRSALQSGAVTERAPLTEEAESDTANAAEASRLNVAAAATPSSEEEAAPPRQAKVIEVAAAAAAGSPHETAREIAQEAAVSMPSASISVEQRMSTERSAGEAPAISVDETNGEAQQELWMEAAAPEEIAASTQVEAEGADIASIDEALPNKEPVLPDEAPPFIADINSNGFANRAESERAASVLRLAEVGSDDAFSKIGAAFDDPAQEVRDAAARSLFNFSADRVTSFKRIMQESSTERRRRIGAAIVSSGMASEAIGDLSGASGEKAYDALLVLSLMAKAGEVQSLVNTIEEHPSTEVRLALVKLLALSGQQEVVSAFRKLATRDQLPIAVRSSIMEAIYQINNPRPFELS